MTQQQEKISAFVDGELEQNGIDEQSQFDASQHTVEQLLSDPEMANKWKRYHLVRDCLRGDISTDTQFDISAQVAKALESELAIVAPKRTWRELPVVAAVIPLVKQSGQLAVAACVTAVMIFSYQSYNQPEAEQPFLTAPPVAGVQGGLAPVSLSQRSAPSRNDMSVLLEQRRQINALIEDHRRQLKLKNAGLFGSTRHFLI